MKITFMGTSHGVPSAERYCSSTMIQTNGSAYIIDAGAPITDTVLRSGEIFDNVRGIFTTHCHGDHIDGIFHFIDLSMWYWKNTNYDVYLTSEAVIDAIHAVIRAVSPGAKFPEERLRLHLATADTKFKDNNIKLSYIPTKPSFFWRSFSRPRSAMRWRSWALRPSAFWRERTVIAQSFPARSTRSWMPLAASPCRVGMALSS